MMPPTPPKTHTHKKSYRSFILLTHNFKVQVLATICEALSQDSILLIYISAAGYFSLSGVSVYFVLITCYPSDTCDYLLTFQEVPSRIWPAKSMPLAPHHMQRLLLLSLLISQNHIWVLIIIYGLVPVEVEVKLDGNFMVQQCPLIIVRLVDC